MITRAFSVCFEGIEPQLVEIECAISPGLPAFSIIGLPDKAVSEARDRIRSALGALSIALPSRRITINLSPADMPKAQSPKPKAQRRIAFGFANCAGPFSGTEHHNK